MSQSQLSTPSKSDRLFVFQYISEDSGQERERGLWLLCGQSSSVRMSCRLSRLTAVAAADSISKSGIEVT